jgi:hypothetical protein
LRAIGHIELQHTRVSPQCNDPRGDFFCLFATRTTMHHNVEAILRCAQRNRPANAATGAGDEHGAAHESDTVLATGDGQRATGKPASGFSPVACSL